MNSYKIKSPYPYFGAKSKVAQTIWQGFGDIDNYIEPFAGSLAVLLANPNHPKLETVNDINCHIVNFWRAISNDPNSVAKIADYPVTEADLHARHHWIVSQTTPEFIQKITTNPEFYDLKMAGWWVWGMCASIGDNWLKPKGLKALPLLSSCGIGINARSADIVTWFQALQTRVRKVRITCGDWKRILTPSVTFQNKNMAKGKTVGVFLDPPYDLSGRDKVYLHDKNIYKEVCEWAVANGDNPKMRIVVCGYQDGFQFPDSWKEYAWKANGGFANLGNDRGKENCQKERIYFSKYCCQF